MPQVIIAYKERGDKEKEHKINENKKIKKIEINLHEERERLEEIEDRTVHMQGDREARSTMGKTVEEIILAIVKANQKRKREKTTRREEKTNA